MAKYITHLDVSINEVEEKNLQSRGFKKIDVNLNEGVGGNDIYLWYKTGERSAAITRLQVTFSDDMAEGLINAGYTKINKDLNAGVGGNYLYLWHYKGSTEYDTPLVKIDVVTNAPSEASKFKDDWEQLTCNLNRNAGGKWIHIWMKREKQTYISDVIATDSFGSDADHFQQGYIRVDENTNRDARGAKVFIWYRQTTDPQRALSDLNVSTDHHEYQSLQQQNYQLVSVDLNQGTGGNQVYMWYKKEGNGPIKAITVLDNTYAAPEYERAGVNVIRRNLNRGSHGSTLYLCFNQ